LIDEKHIHGLVHYTNNVKISKLSLLNSFTALFEKEVIIRPYENYYVDKSLINTRTDIELGIPNYDTMLKELRDFMFDHRDSLYRQYFID